MKIDLYLINVLCRRTCKRGPINCPLIAHGHAMGKLARAPLIEKVAA